MQQRHPHSSRSICVAAAARSRSGICHPRRGPGRSEEAPPVAAARADRQAPEPAQQRAAGPMMRPSSMRPVIAGAVAAAVPPAIGRLPAPRPAPAGGGAEAFVCGDPRAHLHNLNHQQAARRRRHGRAEESRRAEGRAALKGAPWTNRAPFTVSCGRRFGELGALLWIWLAQG